MKKPVGEWLGKQDAASSLLHLTLKAKNGATLADNVYYFAYPKEQKLPEASIETSVKRRGTVMRLGDRPEMNVEAIPTGSLALDAALGIGGVPKGRIIEIYGPESSGKTTLALHILAEAQKRGGEVAFVDAEHALDPVYAAALGVDTDNLLVSQPDTGEQALEITDALVRSGAVYRAQPAILGKVKTL